MRPRLWIAFCRRAERCCLPGCDWFKPRPPDIKFAPDNADYRQKMDFAEVEYKYPLLPADLCEDHAGESRHALAGADRPDLRAPFRGTDSGRAVRRRHPVSPRLEREVPRRRDHGRARRAGAAPEGHRARRGRRALWHGKVFFRDERVLRNRIDDLAALKKLGLVEGDPKKIDHQRQGCVAPVPRQALLRPEPVRFAARVDHHRLLLHRRDSRLSGEARFPRRPARRARARRDPDGAPGLLSRPRLSRSRVRAEFHALQQGHRREGRPGVRADGTGEGRLLAGYAGAGVRKQVTSKRRAPGNENAAQIDSIDSGGVAPCVRVARHERQRPAVGYRGPVIARPLRAAGSGVDRLCRASTGSSIRPSRAMICPRAAARCSTSSCRRSEAASCTRSSRFLSARCCSESRRARGARQTRADGATKAVLIPLGRSLQRNSAAPEFFAYPRVVVAVDAEPAGQRRPLPQGPALSRLPGEGEPDRSHQLQRGRGTIRVPGRHRLPPRRHARIVVCQPRRCASPATRMPLRYFPAPSGTRRMRILASPRCSRRSARTSMASRSIAASTCQMRSTMRRCAPTGSRSTNCSGRKDAAATTSPP